MDGSVRTSPYQRVAQTVCSAVLWLRTPMVAEPHKPRSLPLTQSLATLAAHAAVPSVEMTATVQ
jgi:hypothetical protein